MEEIWKPIEGYDGLYEISSYGNVKALQRTFISGRGLIQTYPEHLMNLEKTKCGYLRCSLCKDGKHKRFLVHRLVAKSFIENPNNYPEINHIDEDKTNNHLENLEWITSRNNVVYSQGVKCICIEDSKIFNSFADAAREYDTDTARIHGICRSKYGCKTVKGKHFKIYEEI